MIDLTNAIEEINYYKGSEKKKTLLYKGKKYLVKFPDPIREKGKNISYINNAFSEYVGSNIFRLCEFNVQNTMLAIYKYNEREKIVCACEDFTDRNHILYEFENLALSTNPDKKIETELLTELHLKSIESFENIKINEKLDYWLYCDSKGKYYTSSNIINAPRSIFMNLIAKQINLKLPYEWRNNVTKKEYIDEIIEIFNDNRNFLKNIWLFVFNMKK